MRYDCDSEIFFIETLDDENSLPYSSIFRAVVPNTISRYIGLEDADGTKIFDGDIVEGHWTCSDVEVKSVLLVDGIEPFFEETGLSSGVMFQTSMSSCNFKIIGNKFNNPELLDKISDL